MKTFLSIDWDYFADATLMERLLQFPDGGNEYLPMNILTYIWATRYSASSNTKGCRVIEEIPVYQKDYEYLMNYLSELKNLPNGVIMTESHAAAYDVIKYGLDKDKTCRIVNIDFHHDLYENQLGRVDCGNWLSELLREGLVKELYWVCRSDSEDLPDEYYQNEIIKRTDDMISVLSNIGKIDGIFICRSGVWSPPHLDTQLFQLRDVAVAGNGSYVQDLKDRYTEEFKKMVQEENDLLQKMM